MPQDLEEMALTMNGKKNRLKRMDFDKLGESLGISTKAMERVYQKFTNKKESMKKLIHESFLNQSLADEYLNLVMERGENCLN
jgi:serine/threonine-protein kinase HipA